MLYTVIIPAYNCSNTIEKSINSVVKQTKSCDQIIVVDDFSNDNTYNILQKIKTKYSKISIEIYRLERNMGPSAVRNFGLDKSSNDIVAFLDSDDYWHPKKMEIILRAHELTDADIIGHNYNLKINRYRNFDNFDVNRVNKLQLLLKNPIQTSTIVCFNKKNLIFPENMRYSEDYCALLLAVFTNSMKLYKVEEELTSLGRPQLSSGGLSESRFKMRKGEIYSYIKSLKNTVYFPLLPLLIFFSIFKHIIKPFK